MTHHWSVPWNVELQRTLPNSRLQQNYWHIRKLSALGYLLLCFVIEIYIPPKELSEMLPIYLNVSFSVVIVCTYYSKAIITGKGYDRVQYFVLLPQLCTLILKSSVPTVVQTKIVSKIHVRIYNISFQLRLIWLFRILALFCFSTVAHLCCQLSTVA